MRNEFKITLLLLLSLFTNCNKEVYDRIECDQGQENEDQVLFINCEESNNIYRLSSGFYIDFVGSFAQSEGNLFVKLGRENGDLDIMYTIKDTTGQIREIPILIEQSDFYEKNHRSKRVIRLELLKRLSEKGEKYLVFKIHGLLDFTTFKEKINGLVFYQLDKGFIGSYLEIPSEPNAIINKTGNILESMIDYSGKENRRMR